jgi:hypothetical protein
MIRQSARRRTVGRVLVAATAAAMLALTAGCASGGGATPSTKDAAQPAGDDGGGFCEQTAGLGEALVSLLDESTDAKTAVDIVATARGILTEVDPPAPIADAWAFLTQAMTTFDHALADADVEAGEKLRLDGEEAFATMIQLPGQVETVGLHLQEECGTDLGMTARVVSDVCAVVDPAFLGSVFRTAPAGEPRAWGEGTVECMWTEGDAEVGAIVGPATTMFDDLVKDALPISSTDMDGYTIDVYEGAFGPLRASTTGRTAAAMIGGSAVLVSVSTGDDAADELKAVALAGLIADEVGAA